MRGIHGAVHAGSGDPVALVVALGVFALVLGVIYLAWTRTDTVQKFKREMRNHSHLERVLARWEESEDEDKCGY